MKIRWNYSDIWAKGIFAFKKQRPAKTPKTDAIRSTLDGILSQNVFGRNIKFQKRSHFDEFMNFKYPEEKLIDKILRNL